MINSAHGGITVFVFFDTRRSDNNDKFPVKIRVRYQRDRKDYSTGQKLTEEEWEQLPKNKSAKFIKLRNDVQTTFKLVDSAVESLYRDDEFSFTALSKVLSRGTADTINTAFKARISILADEGRAGTQLYYNSVLNSIVSYKGEHIKFVDITADWLKKYEKYLLDDGKTYTTVGIYMRAIRAIINEGKKNGIIKEAQYPFGKDKYEIPIGEGRKLALNMQQIKTLVTYTDGREATERYRDLWFFSYLCNGINFTDLLKLKFSNIVGDEICFYRQKTIRTSKVKREIQAMITPEIQSIIDRWGNSDKNPDNYIFPYLKGGETPMQERKKVMDVTKRTNRKLKEISEAIGIKGISTYTARHSYATVLKRSGTNIAFISESLGHNDLKTTENYLASFEQEERKKNAALLTQGFYD
ncbi:MAG: site-specific integrase [Bacteroidales bacterium]|jgi:integrase|nr:site-specific integrase [Bacteroidales bacterium]